jgi:hypothetical protein
MDAMTAFERVEFANAPLSSHLGALVDFLTQVDAPVSVAVANTPADLALLSLLCMAYPKVPATERPAVRLLGVPSALSSAILDHAASQGWAFEVTDTRSSHLLLAEYQGDASGRACGDEGLRYWHVPRRVGFAPLHNWTSAEIGAFLCGGNRLPSGVKGQPAPLSSSLASPYLAPWGQDVRELLVPSSPMQVVTPVHTE